LAERWAGENGPRDNKRNSEREKVRIRPVDRTGEWEDYILRDSISKLNEGGNLDRRLEPTPRTYEALASHEGRVSDVVAYL
jgi:hypothetical protein